MILPEIVGYTLVLMIYNGGLEALPNPYPSRAICNEAGREAILNMQVPEGYSHPLTRFTCVPIYIEK